MTTPSSHPHSHPHPQPIDLRTWQARWRSNCQRMRQLQSRPMRDPSLGPAYIQAFDARAKLLMELVTALAHTEMLEADILCRPDLIACQEAAGYVAWFAAEDAPRRTADESAR